MGLMLTNTRVLGLSTGTAIGNRKLSKICQILKLANTRENLINEKLYEIFYAY